MQTFLPYPDFYDSMKCLDNRRLGKQRVEAYQILNILYGYAKTNAWKNHPAVLMWKGYEEVLKSYYNAALREWKNRGFNNIILQEVPLCGFVTIPNWLGNEKLHSSHRSNLLRKDKIFYGKFNWKEKENMPYYWPIKKEKSK